MRTATPGHRQKGHHATHQKQSTAPRLGTPPGRHQQAGDAPPAREATRGAVKHPDRKPPAKSKDES